MDELFGTFQQNVQMWYRAMCGGYVSPWRYRWIVVRKVAKLACLLLVGLTVARKP